MQWNWRSIVIGLSFLAFLITTKFVVSLASAVVTCLWSVYWKMLSSLLFEGLTPPTTGVLHDLYVFLNETGFCVIYCARFWISRVTWQVVSSLRESFDIHWILNVVHILQAKKWKKLFWVAAIAPLLSVILATVFVYITRADKHGVTIVRLEDSWPLKLWKWCRKYGSRSDMWTKMSFLILIYNSD